MADEEEGVIVTLEPDLFEGKKVDGEDKPRAANGQFVRADAAEPAEDLAQQFKDMEAERDRERVAREASDRRAAQAADDATRARQDAATARTEVVEREFDTVASGLGAAQTEIDSAKRDIKAYGEAADFDKQADAYDRLADARSRFNRLSEAKADLEVKRKSPADDEVRTRTEAPQRQQTPPDPVEAYVANRTPPTAQWLRAHPEWVTDSRKNNKLTSAHYSAVSEGIAVDTPEYFEHVETFIGLKTNGAGNGAANGANGAHRQQQQSKPRRTSVPVAPVQASGGGTSGGGKEVRLSPREAAAAQDGTHIWNYDDPSPQKRYKKGDPIGIQEFARRKDQMQKDGHYDKSYTEA